MVSFYGFNKPCNWCHWDFRHEPPVMACDVLILQKEPDVLTICKPASVPVSMH